MDHGCIGHPPISVPHSSPICQDTAAPTKSHRSKNGPEEERRSRAAPRIVLQKKPGKLPQQEEEEKQKGGTFLLIFASGRHPTSSHTQKPPVNGSARPQTQCPEAAKKQKGKNCLPKPKSCVEEEEEEEEKLSCMDA